MRHLSFMLCISLFSANIFADSTAAAIINTQLGFSYLSEGLYAEAKNHFLQGLEEAPKNASSWYGMAYYLEKTGNIKLARQDYEKALSLEPHSGEAENNYGGFLCRQKEYAAAVKAFIAAANEATYLHPEKAYDNAGVCMLQTPSKAKNYFMLALQHNPNDSRARFYLAKLSRMPLHKNADANVLQSQ